MKKSSNNTNVVVHKTSVKLIPNAKTQETEKVQQLQHQLDLLQKQIDTLTSDNNLLCQNLERKETQYSIVIKELEKNADQQNERNIYIIKKQQEMLHSIEQNIKEHMDYFKMQHTESKSILNDLSTGLLYLQKIFHESVAPTNFAPADHIIIDDSPVNINEKREVTDLIEEKTESDSDSDASDEEAYNYNTPNKKMKINRETPSSVDVSTHERVSPSQLSRKQLYLQLSSFYGRENISTKSRKRSYEAQFKKYEKDNEGKQIKYRMVRKTPRKDQKSVENVSNITPVPLSFTPSK